MKKLAIYLKDSNYENRLVNYLTPRIEHEFLVVSYTQREKFISIFKSGTEVTMIMEEDILDDLDESEIKSHNIICLTEKNITKKQDGIIFIYKYDKASVIVSHLVSEPGKTLSSRTKESLPKIIGVYSPLGGIGTTSLSLSIAEGKSQNNRVLYINLESFGCIGELLFLEEKYSLSELIYYFAAGDKMGTEDFKTYTQRVEDFDIIAPIRNIKEMQSVDADTWIKFISFLRNSDLYNMYVIEFSEAVNGIMEIFPKLDLLIIPYREGNIRQRKLETFKRELINEIGEDINGKLVKYIEIPFFNEQEDEYEGINNSKIGKWAGKIIDKL